jgi:hypothetical protein
MALKPGHYIGRMAYYYLLFYLPYPLLETKHIDQGSPEEQ